MKSRRTFRGILSLLLGYISNVWKGKLRTGWLYGRPPKGVRPLPKAYKQGVGIKRLVDYLFISTVDPKDITTQDLSDRMCSPYGRMQRSQKQRRKQYSELVAIYRNKTKRSKCWDEQIGRLVEQSINEIYG